ncbi:hypothetical protein Droror1_Dr00015886 [Drosera rotundifolia]
MEVERDDDPFYPDSEWDERDGDDKDYDIFVDGNEEDVLNYAGGSNGEHCDSMAENIEGQYEDDMPSDDLHYLDTALVADKIASAEKRIARAKENVAKKVASAKQNAARRSEKAATGGTTLTDDPKHQQVNDDTASLDDAASLGSAFRSTIDTEHQAKKSPKVRRVGNTGHSQVQVRRVSIRKFK